MPKTCLRNLWKLPSPMYFRPKLFFVAASCFSVWKKKSNDPSEIIWPHPLCPPLFDYENDDTPYSVQFVWCPRRLLSLMLESLESCCYLVWHITYCTGGVQKGRRKAFLMGNAAYVQVFWFGIRNGVFERPQPTFRYLYVHKSWRSGIYGKLEELLYL